MNTAPLRGPRHLAVSRSVQEYREKMTIQGRGDMVWVGCGIVRGGAADDRPLIGLSLELTERI
jgi:hypothetical protein